MNRSERFVVSVFVLAFAFFGTSVLMGSNVQASSNRDTLLARQDLGDFDGDGQPNFQDMDDDGDGVYDEDDAAPYDPNIQNQSQLPTAVPDPDPTAVPSPAPTTAPVPTTEPEPAATTPSEAPSPAPEVPEPSVPATEIPAEAPAEPAPQEVESEAPVAQVPVVAALPETGVGDTAGPSGFAISVVIATSILIGAGSQLR